MILSLLLCSFLLSLLTFSLLYSFLLPLFILYSLLIFSLLRSLFFLFARYFSPFLIVYHLCSLFLFFTLRFFSYSSFLSLLFVSLLISPTHTSLPSRTQERYTFPPPHICVSESLNT